MGVLSVVLASPTLLVFTIAAAFGALVWFVFLRRDDGKKEQTPKRYQPAGAAADADEAKKDKPATPDRRVAHLRTPASRSCAISSPVPQATTRVRS